MIYQKETKTPNLTVHAEHERHIELMESDSRFIGMEATWRCEFSGTDSSESYDLLITRHQKGVTRKLRFYSEFPFSAHFLSKTLTGDNSFCLPF